MNNENCDNKNSGCIYFLSFLVLSLSIAIGLLGAGYYVGKARQTDKYVEVKGLDERTVKSDFVSWTINYKSTGPTLEAALAAAERSQINVLQFLKLRSFTDSEIEIGQTKVVDKQADAYNNNVITDNRFIVEASVTLRTEKVDDVVKMSQQTLDLAKSGVTLSSDYYNQGPKFEFRGLNAIKPEMIANATKSARQAADQFAQDSGSGVGSIRNASQGYFSISPLSAGEGQTSLFQQVRVVSTIQFFLEE